MIRKTTKKSVNSKTNTNETNKVIADAASEEELNTKEKEIYQKLEEESKQIESQAQILLENEKQLKESLKEEKKESEAQAVKEQSNPISLPQKKNKDMNETSKTVTSDNKPSSDLESQLKSLKTKVTILSVAVILAIGAAGFGAYYFNEHKYDDLHTVTNSVKESKNRVNTVEKRISGVYEDINEKNSRMDALFTSNANLKEQNNAIKASCQALNQQVKVALEEASKINIRLNNYEARNPNDWLIAQSYFLVSNAQNLLSYTDNIDAALLNLNQADLLLVKIDTPKITHLRELIIDDILALKIIQQVDTKGITYKLDSVYNNIDNMPLNEFLDKKDQDKLFKNSKETSSLNNNWKDNLLDSFKKFSSRFIEIRRRNDTVVNQFLSPSQIGILSKNIKTEILLSKIALFNHNQDEFAYNIDEIIKHISTYYDVNNEVVNANIETLTELKDSSVAIDKPDFLKSYEQFNIIAKEYFHLYTAQKNEKEGN